MKKALSLVLALLMLMSLCITPVMAAEPEGSESNPYYVANPMAAPGFITIPANSAVYYQYKAAVFNGWEVGGYGLTSIIVDGVVYDTPDMWGEIYAPLNFNMMSPGIVAYVNDTAEDVQVMISHNEPLGTENNPDELVEGENSYSIPTNLTSYTAVYMPTANGEYTFSTAQAEDFMIYVDVDGEIYLIEDGSLTLELESYISVVVTIQPVGLTGDVTLTVTAPKAGTEGNPHWLEVDTLYEINGTEPTYFQVDGSLSGNKLLVESFNGTDLTITLDGVDYIAKGGALYLPLETENWVMDLVISQASSDKNTVYFSIQYAEGTEQNPIELVDGDNEISIPEGGYYYYEYTAESESLLVITPADAAAFGLLDAFCDATTSYAYLQEGASSVILSVPAGATVLISACGVMDEETWINGAVDTVLNIAVKDLVLYDDFEDGNVDGWSSDSPIAVDDMDYASGWYSAKFDVTRDWVSMYRYLDVEPNTDYEISFKAKGLLDKGFWVKFNNNWGPDLDSKTVTPTTEWADYSVVLNSGEASKVILMLQHTNLGSDGQVLWFDDITVTKAEGGKEPSFDGYIYNGDFETGDNTGWEIWQSTEITADAAHSGKFGAHLQGNGGWGGMLNQTIAVEAGKTYKLSFWLNVVATGCNVQVKDGSGVAIEGAGGWFDAKNVDKLVEWTFVATDDKVLINFCGGGNGNAESVYVDDFSLVEVNPPSFDGYITNGDFETGDLSSWTNLWGSCTVSFVEGYESTTAISVSGGSWTQVRQNGIAIEPDTDYILTAWVKNANNFALAVKTGDDSADIKTAGPLNNTEWTKVELKFNTGVDKDGNELEINSICVLLMSWDGGGSAIVDNVTLVKDEGGDEPGDDPIAPPVPPEVPENAIVNDNFDNGETQGWSSGSDIAVVDGVYVFQCTKDWANMYKYVNAMKPNTDYVYRFNARANMDETMNIKVNNNWAGDTGVAVVNVTTEWQTYEVVVNSGDLTSTALVLFSCNVKADKGLILYLDNISIAEVKDELPEGYVCYEDFENGTGTWGTNADATIETVPYADVPVANANGGDYALKHTIPSGKYPFISDRTPYAVEPNTDYTISIDVLNTKSNWPIQILVGTDYWFGGSVYNSDAVVPGTSAWGTYTFHFNSGDNTELYFGMKSQWADTVVYFDNFTVSVKTDDPVNPDDFDSGLIENGGFETGNESGWQIWQSTAISADAAHSGSYGAHLQGNGGWGGMLNQTVAVEAGKTYKLSFWINVVATGCNIQVKDGSGVAIEGAGGWFDAKNVDKLVEWTFVATDDSVFINFCGGGNGNAESVYVDDFSLVEVNPPSNDGYITNGDFETGDLTSWINLWDGCTVDFVEGYESDTAISITAGNWSQVRQNNIAVEPNTDYVLSAWVKDAKNFGLIVKSGDDSGDINNAYIEECGDWTQYTVEFNSGDQTSICVLLIGWEGGGYATVDNVTLAEAEIPGESDVEGNLFVNGTFEGGNADGWQTYQGSDVSADAAKNGNYGFNAIGNGGWGGMFNQTIAIETGKTYTLSFWIKVVSNGVNVQVKDADGTKFDGSPAGWYPAANYSEWTYVSKTFVAHADTLIFNVCGSGNGTAESVYFDSIALVKEKDPSFDGYITNGDFEMNNLAGWINLWNSCTVEFVEGYESDYALSIVMPGQWQQVRQDKIAVEANTTYRLSAYVKSAQDVAFVIKEGNDSFDLTPSEIGAFPAGDEWQQFTMEFNTGVNKDGDAITIDSICILVISYGENGGSVIIDNITLEKVEEIEPEYLPGDVSDDGRVNNRDLGMLQQYLSDMDVKITNMNACDVTGDGRVNNRDLGVLQQYLSDMDVELKYGAIEE